MDQHRASVPRRELIIRSSETSGILPPATGYFSEPVPRVQGTARERAAERAAWFERAGKAMAHSNLVFLDPDNGLEVNTMGIRECRSPRCRKIRSRLRLYAESSDADAVIGYILAHA
jgi:hypothetical protein